MKNLKIAVVSDVHLGHRRNDARNIAENLRLAFPDNAETADLDILFLAGDIFDDLLSLPHEDVVEIDLWIVYLLRLVKKHDITLRVLEGTPSHDWKQSERFSNINQLTSIDADLKYVKDLSIEYIEKFDIHVLYVPDEWDSTEKTLNQIHDLLKAKGLEKVDFAIMHGQFEYQLPPHVKAQKHNSEAYLKIVEHLIFIGHVHVHSRYDRIIAQGSFDRLSHGEEGPKGHVRAVVSPDGRYDVVFMENKHAKIFLTVRVHFLSLEETIETIDRQVQALPEGSQVRVEANYDHPIFANMEMLIRRHPLFTWTKLPREDEEQETAAIIEDETIFIPITLTRDNIGGLLMERAANSGATSEILTAAELMLREVL